MNNLFESISFYDMLSKQGRGWGQLSRETSQCLECDNVSKLQVTHRIHRIHAFLGFNRNCKGFSSVCCLWMGIVWICIGALVGTTILDFIVNSTLRWGFGILYSVVFMRLLKAGQVCTNQSLVVKIGFAHARFKPDGSQEVVLSQI